MLFQSETSFEEIDIPSMMEKAAKSAVGFLVAMSNVFINQDDTLSVKGRLPILRILDNQNLSKEELIVRPQSYPLGISGTYTIPNSKRAEMNWKQLEKLPDRFRSACSLQYQACKIASNPFEDRINSRIWRLNEQRFKRRMSEMEKISVACQTWPQAKRQLEFLHLSPKLSSDSDSEITKPKKRRRIILSDSEDDGPADGPTDGPADGSADKPTESALFDFTSEQLEEMSENLDLDVFNKEYNFLLRDAECDDKEDDEVINGPNEEDAAFLNDDVIKNDVFVGNIQYTEAQKTEFCHVKQCLINGETFELKMLTESDILKICSQSTDGFLPIGMSGQIKQCLKGKVQADENIKNFFENLTEINFCF